MGKFSIIMAESSRAKYSGGKRAFHSDLRARAVRGDSGMIDINVRLGTLNVGSMTGKGRELVDLMVRRRVNILCVQETRWMGDKAKVLAEGYKLFYSSASKDKRNGVGIVVDKDLVEEVCEVDRVNDRIMSVKVVIGNQVCRVVCVYAPQVGCSDSEKEEFWVQLDDVVMNIPGTERLYVCGDFNGHVGGRESEEYEVHGGHGYGTRNDEGGMIVEHAKAFDMRIANTFYKKREQHLITYQSGGNKTQIDYILCRRCFRREVRDCKVINGESVTSQHRLLVMDMSIRVQKGGVCRKEFQRKIKWWRLKEENVTEEYRDKVLESVVEKESVESWWNANSSVIKRVASQVLGKSSGKGVPVNKEAWWWSKEVQEVIKEKKVARKNWYTSGRDEDREEFKRAKKRAKKAVAIAKAKAIDDGYKDIENNEGEMKLLRIAKAKDKESKDITVIKQIKDTGGKVLRNQKDIKDRWKEYFEALLNEENEREIFEEGEGNPGIVNQVTREEVEKAVKKMKKGKAVGADGIPVEAWKCLGDDGIDILWDLMRRVMCEEKIPNEWRKSVMVPIFKGKGDVQECGNYRGIKLMSHTLKIWERIVENRIREESMVSEEQFGFMPGRGTTDAVFAIRRLMEKCREMQCDLHMAFIDLEKAYDRVPREEVWRCMRVKGIPEKYVRLVKEMYREVRTVVRSSVGVTEGFDVKVGLHQGSVLSPYLFDLVMDVLTEDIKRDAPWNMMFADDIVLCEFTREGLELKLEKWRRAFEQRGLRISRTKTEYLTTCQVGCLNLRLQDQLLPAVDKFKYLGSVLEKGGDLGSEINHRVSCGWMNWRKLSSVLCDRKISGNTKGRLYRRVVRPALMYGAETWAVTKAQERKLEVAEMRMIRWMCGLTRRDRVRNERIRGTVKVGPLGKKIQESRLRWFGHVERRDESYIGKRVETLDINGKRKRGRPKLRWSDKVEEDLREKGWNREDTLDRGLWRGRLKEGNADPK